VIVDAHAMFRHNLRKLFDEYPGFCIAGEASSGTEAIDIVHELALDIMLLGLQLRDMNGLTVLQRVGRDTNFKIILLGDIQRKDEIRAILFGASGIVQRSASCDTLFKSIQSVLNGEIWSKRDLLGDLIATLSNPSSWPLKGCQQLGLTSRELDIICAVSQGLDNRAISEMLGISPFTVKHYLTRIFGKLGMNNRVDLTLFAKSNGLAASRTGD
jgi:two-component system nitrate/nitrite response regulator NarL